MICSSVGAISAVESDPGNFGNHEKMLAAFTDPYPITDMSYLDAYKAIASPVVLDSIPQPKRSETSAGFWSFEVGGNAPGWSAGPASVTKYTAYDLQGTLPLLYRLGAC